MHASTTPRSPVRLAMLSIHPDSDAAHYLFNPRPHPRAVQSYATAVWGVSSPSPYFIRELCRALLRLYRGRGDVPAQVWEAARDAMRARNAAGGEERSAELVRLLTEDGAFPGNMPSEEIAAAV